MRPYPDELLRAIQAGVGAHLAPEVQSTYGRAQFGFAMLLFTIAQRDYDSAVPDLIADNQHLRDILAETADALAAIKSDTATELRRAIAALEPPITSLRLSDLRTENATLRTALANAAPLIEPAADDAALAPLRNVRMKVFAYLKSDAKQRVVPILSA